MAITWSMNNRYAASYVITGAAPVEGFDIAYSDHTRHPSATPASIFSSFANNLDLDIVDLPFINYLILRDMGKEAIALPCFPTMFNPILGAMVHRKAGIRTPKDLEGRKVGVSGFCFNPATWLRGIMADHYGVQLDAIHWVEGEPNSMSGVAYPRHDRFKIEKAANLLDLAKQGTIDALIMSDGGIEPTDELDRLFPDFWPEVQGFYNATGVFPINSVVVVKKAVLEANPGLASAIAKAFAEAWTRYVTDAPDDSLHMGLEVGELRKRGMFPHQDGLEANRAAVNLIVRYAQDQGLVRGSLRAEELFAEI